MKKIRSDRIEVPYTRMTKEGYIETNAIVTRTGVFKYLNEDGSIRRELRHPDDVFKTKSLDSLQRRPVTLNHPTELVNSKNASQYQKGYTGDEYSVDGEFVKLNLTVTHEDAVTAIDSGKVQLSLGYEVELIEEVGEYNGERYDHRQTEIEYNHLAIVDRARAGDKASIKFDSEDEAPVNMSISETVIKQSRTDSKTEPTRKVAKMKTIVVDGVAVQVEDGDASKVETAVANLKQKADNASTKASELQAKLDASEGEVAKLKEEIKTANSDEVVAKLVKARVDLETKAKKVVGDGANFDGKSDLDVKKEAVKAFDANANLDGDEAYINAFFDIAVSRSDAGDGEGGNNEEAPTETKTDGISSQRSDAFTPKTDGDEDEYRYDSEDEERNKLMKRYKEKGAK